MKEIPTTRPINCIKTACVTSNTLIDMMHKSDYENIVTGVHNYSFIIRGKGRMTGKEFADCCRKVYTDKNPANASYYSLFEKYISYIESTYGQIRVGYDFSSNPD